MESAPESERTSTDEPAIEAQMLRARRLEAVGRLVSAFAQEFDNVHTAILSLAEFIADAATTGVSSRADLDEITRQAMRGSRLARQLMALSTEPPTARPPESANGVIRNLEMVFRGLAGDGAFVTLDLSREAAPVLVDPLALELILIELVRDALRATHGHGRITLSSAVRSFDAHDSARPYGVPAGAYVEIAVRGTGDRTGAPALREDAAGDAVPAKLSGEDVALALAETAAARLNGFLAMSTARDGDTAAALYVPALGMLDAPIAAEAPIEHETVLVVEDEAPVRDVICRMLIDRGYHVLRAANGEDALAVVGEYGAPIHLVVSDVVMPEMDGRVLFDHLRAWYPTLRFVLISGYTRGALSAEQLTDGITEFLPKPFTLDDLANTVEALLAKSAA